MGEPRNSMNAEQHQVLCQIAAHHPEPVGNSIHLQSKRHTHQQMIRIVGRLLEQGLVQAVIVQIANKPDYLRIQLTAAGLVRARERVRKRRWLFYVMLCLLVLPLAAGIFWLAGLSTTNVPLYVQVHWHFVAGVVLGCLGAAMLMAWIEPWR